MDIIQVAHQTKMSWSDRHLSETTSFKTVIGCEELAHKRHKEKLVF